jgi:O-antigen/teichoic acid export membrane protein
VFNIQTAIQPIFIQSIRLGSVALLVRSLDSIFVSVLRAYEKYRPAVQIAVLSRSLVIVAAVVLVARGSGVVSIMVATVAVNTAGMILQGLAVRSHVGRISLLPSWNHELLPTISSFGCFSWLQALSGIVFGQADRLIVGALLGTSAVAYYSICTQAAQPIHGIIASALHFLFPHLSAKHSTSPITELRPIVTMAFLVNLGLVAFLCLPMVFLSKLILTVWMGATFASRGAPILSLTAIGFGLVGINVTGHYVLMAVGAIRYVTLLNLAAGLAMICAIVALILPFGLMGAAVGRLVYGPVTWLMYLKIYRMLKAPSLNSAMEERLAEFSEEVC